MDRWFQVYTWINRIVWLFFCCRCVSSLNVFSESLVWIQFSLWFICWIWRPPRWFCHDRAIGRGASWSLVGRDCLFLQCLLETCLLGSPRVLFASKLNRTPPCLDIHFVKFTNSLRVMNFHDEFVKFSKNLSNSLSYLPERPTEMGDVPTEESDELTTSDYEAMDTGLPSCRPSQSWEDLSDWQIDYTLALRYAKEKGRPFLLQDRFLSVIIDDLIDSSSTTESVIIDSVSMPARPSTPHACRSVRHSSPSLVAVITKEYYMIPGLPGTDTVTCRRVRVSGTGPGTGPGTGGPRIIRYGFG